MKISPIPRRELPVFAGIEEKDLDALLLCLNAYTRRYRAGEFVLLDQDEVRHVGLVLSGKVHALKEDSLGHKTLLAYLEAGEVFGETFAVKKEPESYVSFYAAANTQVLFLSMEHLLHPCKLNCPFHERLAENVFHLLCEENLRLIEKIEVCAKGSLREKILAYLNILARKQGQKYITVPLNRTEMASYLQSNRSAMSRELAEMKAEGIIDYDGSTFVLKG